MRPDNGAVDHLDALLDALRLIEGLEKKLPQPCKRPAAELPVDRRPFAEMLVQITPLGTSAGEPEYAIQNKTMILRASSAARTALDHEGLKTGPFLIAHQTTDQGSFLKSYLESELT